MNTLSQIPLHMLLLAGLVGPLAAKDQPSAAPAAQLVAKDEVAYAGLNVGPRTETAIASLPADVGLQVFFVDPKGPSAGKVEEGDVLTRFDDQMLFNADQFRAVVRTRKPGDKVKVTVVRRGEPMVVELTLGARAEEKGRPAGRAGRPGAERTPDLTVVPGGGIPPEILQRLQELQAGALPRDLDALRVAPGTSSSARSFSFSFGNGAKSSSQSMASDGEGTVALEEKDGKKRAIVKDRDGKTLFDGDVTDQAAAEKLPADIRRRLKLVEGKNFTLPGFPGPATPAPAEKPKAKFDPKQGA